MKRYLLALVITAAGSAFGADLISIYQPIQVTQINPLLTQVGVRCDVMGTDLITTRETTFAHQGPQWFPLTAGSFSGTATFVFRTEDFSATRDPVYATRAICGLWYRGTDGTNYQMGDGASGPILGNAAGTPFRWQSIRSIP